MPRLSKKKSAARKNWDAAVNSIRTGTKRALEILTPRKKKRRIGDDKENARNTESVLDQPPDDDISETGSFGTRSCPDDDFFTTPGPSFVRDFDRLPTDARSQFGIFSADTRVSPAKSTSLGAKSASLGRFWKDLPPRLLNKLSPSRRSASPRVFDDNDSILAQRSPRPARMFDDTSSVSDSDSLDFHFTSRRHNGSIDYASSINPPDSVDSASLDSVSRNNSPTSPLPTEAELAERAQQREKAAAATEGRRREAPTIEAARAALQDIGKVLRPPRKKGPGYIDPHLDPFTRSRVEGIQSLLALYTHPSAATHGQWKKASMNAVITLRRGNYCARVLRRLARQYIADRSVLPENPYGNWNETLLVNEDLCNELMEYLQILGSTKDEQGRELGITSAKVQAWLRREDIMRKYGITKQISSATAKRYLHALGFRFASPLKGQYVDGHERADVRAERDKVYVPRLSQFRRRMRVFDKDGKDITEGVEAMVASGKRVVIWYHDESIFYAHDRHRKAGGTRTPQSSHAKRERVYL
ncbi:hypothetical protein B0H13DRAFT_2535256 [Mycena leptocephala]|nr:hypothetical protein B0H13DRAFT_2535256 [Mycena leptocephala]